jgi:hypothetical protein
VPAAKLPDSQQRGRTNAQILSCQPGRKGGPTGIGRRGRNATRWATEQVRWSPGPEQPPAWGWGGATRRGRGWWSEEPEPSHQYAIEHMFLSSSRKLLIAQILRCISFNPISRSTLASFQLLCPLHHLSSHDMNELSVAYLFITFMIRSSSSIQFISQTKQYFEQQHNTKFILEFRLSIIFLDWSYHNLRHLLSYFQTENSSYFIAARHKLNAFLSCFSLLLLPPSFASFCIGENHGRS